MSKGRRGRKWILEFRVLLTVEQIAEIKIEPRSALALLGESVGVGQDLWDVFRSVHLQADRLRGSAPPHHPHGSIQGCPRGDR